MTLTLYKSYGYLGGVLYLQLYIWIIFPQIFTTLQLLFGGDSQVLDSQENLNAFRSLLFVVAPIGYIYIFAAWNGFTSLTDLTIAWRLLWVGPWLFMNTKTSSPLEKSAALVIASLDVGLPVLCIFTCWNTAIGIPRRLIEHFSNSPIYKSRELLMWIGRIGFVFVLLISLDVLLVDKQTYLQSFIVSVVGCYYMFYDWLAKSKEPRALYFTAFVELVLIAHIFIDLYFFKYTAAVKMEAVLALTIISTLLHLYTVCWDYFVNIQGMSYSMWSGIICFIVAVISTIWTLFMPFFHEKAQEISPNQHRFDLMFGFFVFLVCSLMDLVKVKTPFHAGCNAWFLPLALLWYSSEVKMMINNNFGSPYHPSWIVRNITTEKYSGNFVADLTNSFITVMTSVVGATYGAVIILLYLEPKGWTWLTWNGMLLIAVSAIYMLAFGSGIASFTEDGFPPAIPVLFPLDGKDLLGAIESHVRDLIIGMISIIAGISLNTIAKNSTQPMVYLIALSWIFLIVPKIFLSFTDVELV